jgi:hypothetical protein
MLPTATSFATSSTELHSMNSTSEVFVPDVPGRILSAPQARRAMGGTGQRSGDTITVNLYGTDVTAGQVAREIAWSRMVG